MGDAKLYHFAPNATGWVDWLGLAKSSTSGNNSYAQKGKDFHNPVNNPYPSGFESEQTIKMNNGKTGRVDGVNVDEGIVIERKCTCRKRTIKNGEKQVKNYAEALEKAEGKSFEAILEIMDPTTGNVTRTKVKSK